MTDESDKRGLRPDGLIPQPHGGALKPGGTKGQTPGPGRPRSAIRATMRQKLDEQLIDAVIADWEAGKVSSIMAADFFAKYGLGTQTESVSVEDVKEQARAIVEEFTRVARDWGHTEQEIHQGLARLARAARTPHHEEEQ